MSEAKCIPAAACEILDKYLAYLQAVRGVSLRTLEAYSSDLSRYVNYCANYNIEPVKAEAYEVQSFIADYSAEQVSSVSINRALSSIRGFYRWMLVKGKRSDDPCRKLRNVKTPKTLPSVLWEKEMAGFAQLPDSAGILWPNRDKAIIMTMYSAGLRISELVSIGMENITGSLEGAKISGKGGKERYVFFSEEAKEALIDYLPERAARLKTNCKKDESSGPLFVSRNGRKISVPGVRWIIARYAERSYLGKKIHPHSLRHSFATHLVNSGCDVRVVQEMLGHKSLSTTQRYTHVNIEGLKKTYARAHPHAEKQGKINGR